MMIKTLTTSLALMFGTGLSAQLQNNLLSPIGNVGIGTLFPTAKLHVIGNSTFTGDFALAGDATLNGTTTISNLTLPSLNLAVNAAGIDVVVRNPTTGNLERVGMDILRDLVYSPASSPCAGPIGPNGQPLPYSPVWSNAPGKIYVRCPDTVRVGIGTINPTSRLDVAGTLRSSAIVVGIHPDNARATLHVRSQLPQATPGSVLIVENATRRLMQVDNNGLLRAREVKLDVAAWPDYVFETGYKLMTPEEIKAFIAAHHHLPGVPSASELEQEGMDVMAMNATLLKKIEELTLLLLQQQEQINALTNEIRH